MAESLPHHLERLDWGFGNPNKTATFIVLMMVAVWSLAYIRQWGFWPALALFTGLGACLILTQSRGAVVGLLAGGSILITWAPRPFPRSRGLAILLACAGLMIFALLTKADSRYTQGFEGKDLSIENRILVWKQAASMIRDAPQGWGLGKSGDAYMQWYQPLGRGEGYRTLVNSHLTWLVEFNWWGRIAYLIAWGLVLALLWPDSGSRWFSIPLGLWMTLAVCASFSSVEEAALLWIIPLTALLLVIFARFEKKQWPRLSHWVGIPLALLSIGGIWLGWELALAPPSSVYCPHPGVVLFGSKLPKIWIVAPNHAILGEHYGHEVRSGFMAETLFRHLGVAVISHLGSVPPGQTLVFSRQIPPACAATRPAELIVLDPDPVSNDEIQSLARFPMVVVVVGEYSKNKDFWIEQARSHPTVKLEVVEGTEDYFPNWMRDLASAIRI